MNITFQAPLGQRILRRWFMGITVFRDNNYSYATRWIYSC